MPRTHSAATTVLVLAALGSAAPSARAQEVRWRHDYAAARREATETGRPILLDFGTEACSWCKKLDATTFRDPKVVALLNERFVPVKIDAEKQGRLAQALGVESFPTLVLATSDGKVVGRHEGYASVTQLAALLGKAPEAPQVAAAPAKPAPTRADPGAEERRVWERIDADLAALHTKIAASLER